jgi:isopentenyl diphosphate isomerase/L-lactate dehydrogenase-like FMN-dependent dehydrogenase
MMAPISIRLSAGVICNGAAIRKGSMVLKGILDPEDARDAVTFELTASWFQIMAVASWMARSPTARALPVVADISRESLAASGL